MEMKLIDKVVYSLLIIGGLNWGIFGLAEKNVVTKIFGYDFARVIYVIVGLAGLYGVYTVFKMMANQKKK